MVAALLTFASALGIILGAYWLFIVRAEDQAQSSVRRRLKGGNTAREKARLAILKEARKVSDIGFIERALRKNEALLTGLQKRIDQADAQITPSLFILTSGVLGLGTYLAVSFYTPWIAIAILAGIIAVFLPSVWLQRKRSTRLKLIEEQ